MASVTEVYRDPLAGLQAKRAAVEALEGGLHPILWSVSGSDLRGEASLLHERGFAEDSSEANEALDRLTALLDGVASARDQLVSSSTVEEPSEWIEPVVLDDRLFAPMRDGLERALSPWAAAPALVRLDNWRLLARLWATGIPLLLIVRLDVGHVEEAAYLGAYGYECTLRATMPACLPRLELTAERVWHTVEKAVGLAREVQLGDAAFDKAFWVRGDPDVAKGLLVAGVREDLLCLGWRKPRVVLGAGSLEIVWRGSSGEIHVGELGSGIAAAVGVVQGMRGAIERARAGVG
jgi:hypothetical protein